MAFRLEEYQNIKPTRNWVIITEGNIDQLLISESDLIEQIEQMADRFVSELEKYNKTKFKNETNDITCTWKYSYGEMK